MYDVNWLWDPHVRWNLCAFYVVVYLFVSEEVKEESESLIRQNIKLNSCFSHCVRCWVDGKKLPTDKQNVKNEKENSSFNVKSLKRREKTF